MKNGARSLVGRYDKTKASIHERRHGSRCAAFESLRHRVGAVNFRNRAEPYGFLVRSENDGWIEH